MSSKSSKSSMNDFMEQLKAVKKLFTKLQVMRESDDSSSSDDKELHFQYLQFTQRAKEPRDTVLNQSGKFINLDLQEVKLLDNQLTMSLFCNSKLISNKCKSDKPLKLHSNGGTMMINHIAYIGKGQSVWFSKKAIANILSLKHVKKTYPVLYECADDSFTIHREDYGLGNMVFKMHESGLHYHDPQGEDFSFITTVEGNKIPFTKQQIESAEKARSLYASLGYASVKDFKWMLQSQIKDSPVLVVDAEVALKIWGPNIAALKGKTTRSKPKVVVMDIVRITNEIREVHKIISMSIDIFFVNQIPFFITLSRNICFTMVMHLANRKLVNIFKAFKGIYVY